MPKTNAQRPTTAQSLGTLARCACDIMRKNKGLNGDFNRLPMQRSAAVPGCEFEHRPGACSSFATNVYWRRDAARTRSRGRLRYKLVRYAHA